MAWLSLLPAAVAACKPDPKPTGPYTGDDGPGDVEDVVTKASRPVVSSFESKEAIT